MDMITLAMAKAYTDEKCGGGGSGGGLPVVELTSTLTSTAQTLSTEDAAKLKEYANMGTPIILTANVNIGEGVVWRVTGFATLLLADNSSPRYSLVYRDGEMEVLAAFDARKLSSPSWSGFCSYIKIT